MRSSLCIVESHEYLLESHPRERKLRRAFEKLVRASFKSAAVVGTQDSKCQFPCLQSGEIQSCREGSMKTSYKYMTSV